MSERGVATTDNKQREKNEKSSITAVLRDFQGVNTQTAREAIGDTEFAWLENLVSVAPGNLASVAGAALIQASFLSETGPPDFAEFFPNANAWIMAWNNTGNLYAVGAGVALQTTWYTGVAFGGVVATAYGAGVVISVLFVYPNYGVNGLYDYNLTQPGRLARLAGSVTNAVITSPPTYTGGPTPQLRLVNNGAAMPSDLIRAGLSYASLASSVGGTGYQVGDVLTLVGPFGAPAPAPATALTVSAVGGGGSVTGLTTRNPGLYATIPTSPVATTGGSGTGCTVTPNWVLNVPVLSQDTSRVPTRGGGILENKVTVQVYLGAAWVSAPYITVSVFFPLGTAPIQSDFSALATYAGRLWLASAGSGVVHFTDVNTFNSTAGAGGSFTISDAYLAGNVTGLFAANNYLYIFGADSTDILSNVTVTGGVTAFSRLNASAAVGTLHPESVFAYSRSICFVNQNGVYLLSGATPQKVSDNLDGLFQLVDFSKPIVGGLMDMFGQTMPAIAFTFADSITSTGAARTVLAVYRSGKWSILSQGHAGAPLSLATISFTPVAHAGYATSVVGPQTAYGWSGNAWYQLFSAPGNVPWTLKTKLWDGGKPMEDKLGLNAALTATFGVSGAPGITTTVDTEYGSVACNLGTQPASFRVLVNNAGQVVTLVNNSMQVVTLAGFIGFQFLSAPANNGGGKYIGLTMTGPDTMTQLRSLALEYQNTRRW